MSKQNIPGRAYDPALVEAIASRAHTIDSDGLVLEIRPVPDDDREHVLDPRVLAYSRRKLAQASNPDAVEPPFLVLRRGLGKPAQRYDEGTASYRQVLADFGDRFVPVHVITPTNHVAPSPVLVYNHGGGFALGSFEQYAEELYRLADITGAVVVACEYRLSPECPFPAGLDDCCATLDWVRDNADELGIDPAKLALAGDSAGGNLCNAVAQRMPGRIALIVEFYPLVKTGHDREDRWGWEYYPVIPEHAAEAHERVERIHATVGLEEMYTHNDIDALSNPLISAVHCTDFSVFPRTVVVSAEYDFLRVQDEQFAKQLQDAGVDVRAIRYAGVDHGFFEAGGMWPQSEDLCNVIAEEMARAFA